MAPDVAGNILRFAAFALDLEKGTLRRGSEAIFLRPKAYGLLTHLARNMGRIVPKAELMETVWPGVFVTEDSLTQSIREIRKAIGDDLVKTVSKRGYMLAAEAEAAPEVGTQPVIAVLRFRNDGASPADEAIVDGFAEDIINGLARFGTITVLARNSSFSFASYARSDWPRVREQIGADYLVEGSVRRQDQKFLAAVNLVDVPTASQLWGNRYQASGEGLFSIQQDIVEEIVGWLVTKVTNAGLVRSARKPATSLAAYELTVRGVALLRDPAQSDLRTAESLFEAAIAKDSSYGLAHTYFALTRALYGEFGSVSVETLAEAREIADKGAQLSPDQAACRRVQSLIRIYLRQHDAAEHFLRMALDLNPYDPECIAQMGFLLTLRGRPMDALGWLARAVRIDPLHPYWYEYDRALALYLMGEYRAAVDALEQSTRPRPWIRIRLAACHAQLGDMAAARRQVALIASEGGVFSAADYARHGIPFENPDDVRHFEQGVMLALQPLD